jgi:Kef-type K+ transport system membrane component KefB
MSEGAPEIESEPSTARRLLVVAAALALLLGVRALRVEQGLGAADPLTLASCGFVLLAAFTVGELGAVLGLPKVTGYILAGVLVGPQIGDLLSDRVVSELSTFNTLTLGLIAISAGLELHLPAIRKVVPTLGATVLGKLLLLPLFVGLPLYLAESWLGWFGLHATSERLVLALVISVLSIGTSPSIALAVVSDTGAKGRLTDLLLAMAVVKDVVVVTCLAVAVAVAHALLGGGAFEVGVLLHLGEELLASVTAGALVGALFVAYFRYVGAEPLFTALVAILLVAEASRFFHLELLLVFIVAGFVVRNFSPYEHALLDPIERISLPVFVVFFTVAGAGLDLRGTWTILPLAVVLAALRALVYFLASRAGAWLGGEQPPVARNAWLTYLPQAGVTLGLVLLAAEKVPELAEAIERLGLALVALNLLVGPVTAVMGLRGAGETAQVSAPSSPEEAPREDEPATTLRDPSLQALLGELRAQLSGQVADFALQHLQPHADALRLRGLSLAPGEGASRGVRQALSEPVPWSRGALDRAAGALFDEASALLRAQPWSSSVALDEEALATQPSDGWGARLRRWGSVAARRLRLGGRTRQVPVQLALRQGVEPRLAEAAAAVAASFYRAEAEALAVVQGMIQGARPAEPEPIEAITRRWVELAEQELADALRLGLSEAERLLAVAGGPRLPARALRFATVEPRIEAAVSALRADAPRWSERIAAVEDTLRAALLVEGFVTVVQASVGQRARQPLAACRAALGPAVGEVEARLDALLQQEPAAVLAAVDGVLSPDLTSSLHLASEHFRRATQPGPLVADLVQLVRHAPERLVVVSRHRPVHQVRRPGEAALQTLLFADRVDTLLRDELLPAIEAALAPVSQGVASAEGRLREAVMVARYGAELAAQGEAGTDRRALVAEAARRALRQVAALREQLDAAFSEADQQIGEATAHSLALLRGLSADPERGRAARTVLRAAAEAGQRAWTAAVGQGRTLRAATRSLAEQRALLDLKLRSGHQRLDPTGIRQYLDAWLAPPEARGVPAVYARLMSPAPVTERRLFVARADLLEQLLDALSPSPRVAAPSVALLGAQGAGRTSLLNMVKVQLAGPRVLWLDPALAVRGEGLLGALASELGTPAEPAAVVDALLREPSVVLIDDLQCWLEPSAAGLARLEAWARVLDRTVPQTRWLVSMEVAAFELFDEAVGLRRVFRRVLPLPPLDWRELRDLFRLREQLGGFDTDYRSRGLQGRLMDLLRPGPEQDTYFRLLARLSGGNPGVAQSVHLQNVEIEGEGLRAGNLAQPALPFLGQLGEDALALLAALVRFGPMEPRWLAELLQQSEDDVERQVGSLMHAGLLEERRAGVRRVGLPLRLGAALRRELAELGVLSGAL